MAALSFAALFPTLRSLELTFAPPAESTREGITVVTRRLLLLLAIASVCPVVALAAPGVPSPGNSFIPGHINLVGRVGGIPDPIGLFTVLVMDSNNNPVNSPLVEVDFSGCGGVAPGVQYYSGLSLDCVTKRVQGVGGTNGEIQMIITGFGANGPNTVGCATIYANSILLGSVSVSAFDLDGVNGVDLGDLAVWQHDFYGGTNPERSNYDNAGGVGGTDLSLWVCDWSSQLGKQSADNCSGTLIVSPVVNSGAINLAWNDCPAGGGASARTFTCNTNVGAASIIVSAIPAVDIENAAWFAADIDIQTTGGSAIPVPSWWQLAPTPGPGPGCGTAVHGCREAALAASMDFSAGPFSCTDLWGGQGTTISQMFYSVSSPDRATLRVFGVSAADVFMAASDEAYMVKVTIGRQKTVGTGLCPGCLQQMCLQLRSVDVHQDASVSQVLPTYHMTNPAGQTTIGWQASGATCAITPVRNRTWGQIKQQYH